MKNESSKNVNINLTCVMDAFELLILTCGALIVGNNDDDDDEDDGTWYEAFHY